MSPRPRPALPVVLEVEEASALLDAAGSGAAEDDPVALRDLLVLELLYATGVRVAELCSLDIDDVDADRRALRVLGKGDRERTVVYGVPAATALRRWLGAGSARAGPRRVAARVAARHPRRAGWTRGWPGPSCTARSPPCRARPTRDRTVCDTPQPPTCWRAARTSVTYRSCSVTLS